MKILVVEDDGLTAEALVATLGNQNYTVEVASDGEAGWELAEAFPYDLLLLDVTLPKLDGISLCQRLRSHGYQMPILLLTARNSSHDKAIGLDAGADDYVVKPFEPEELAARIRALLRRNQVTVQSTLAWGELCLDPRSCEVTYGIEPVSLTAKEYALLEMFLRNSQRVFSCLTDDKAPLSYKGQTFERIERTKNREPVTAPPKIYVLIILPNNAAGASE